MKKRSESDRESEDGSCPFKQVEDNGGSREVEDILGRPHNAPECIGACRQYFMDSLGADDNINITCASLTQDEPNEELWPLYCCDVIQCGVWVDRRGPLGQDPNIGGIITECQDLGYFSISDPGPPPDGFCNDWYTSEGAAGAFSCQQNEKEEEDGGGMGAFTIADMSTSTQPTATTPTTITATTTEGGTLQDPVSMSNPTQNADSSDSSPSNDTDGISAPAKIAASVCSVIALLGIIALILFLLHRRRKNAPYVRNLRDHIKHGPSLSHTDSPNSISPTPLITPTTSNTPPPPGTGARRSDASHAGDRTSDTPAPTTLATGPLTPPLRLRDRRILNVPNILRSSNSSTPPPAPAQRTFPTAPYCAPTTNKLVPRHERTPKIYGSKIPFLPSVGMGLVDISGDGGGSGTGGGGAGVAGGGVVGGGEMREGAVGRTSTSTTTPPSSPSRPPRPHENMLEIPDLVSPLSPPPASKRHSPPTASSTAASGHASASPSSLSCGGGGGGGGGVGSVTSRATSGITYPSASLSHPASVVIAPGMIGLAITDPEQLSLRGEFNAPAPNPPPTRALPATPTGAGGSMRGSGSVGSTASGSPRNSMSIAGGGKGVTCRASGSGGGEKNSSPRSSGTRVNTLATGLDKGKGVLAGARTATLPATSSVGGDVATVKTAPSFKEERGVIVIPAATSSSAQAPISSVTSSVVSSLNPALLNTVTEVPSPTSAAGLSPEQRLPDVSPTRGIGMGWKGKDKELPPTPPSKPATATTTSTLPTIYPTSSSSLPISPLTSPTFSRSKDNTSLLPSHPRPSTSTITSSIIPPSPIKGPLSLFTTSRPTSTHTATNNTGATPSPLTTPRASIVLSQESQDLADLTESYARSVRSSWGSWSGCGGGGPGVVSPGQRSVSVGGRGSVDGGIGVGRSLSRRISLGEGVGVSGGFGVLGRSPRGSGVSVDGGGVIREDELERLGGGYR